MLQVRVHHAGVLALVRDRVHARCDGRREATPPLGLGSLDQDYPAVLFAQGADHRRSLVGRVVHEDDPIAHPRQRLFELPH
jgi:hypothetical protein